MKPLFFIVLFCSSVLINAAPDNELICRLLRQDDDFGKSLLDQQSWQDLDFDHLLLSIDNTATMAGRWGLRSITLQQSAEPVRTTIDLLRHNPIIRKEIVSILREFVVLQQSLMVQYDPTDHINQLAEYMYFPLWRETTKKYFFPQQCSAVFEKWHVIAQFAFGNRLSANKLYYFFAPPGKGNGQGPAINDYACAWSAYTLFWALMYSPLKKFVDDYQRNTQHAAILQNRLVDISRLFDIAQRFATLLEQHPILTNHPALEQIQSFLQQTKRDEVRRLRNVLATSTFDAKRDVLFLRGRVLQANLLLQDCKEIFTDLLRGIGLMDATMSMVLFIEKSSEKGFSWCRPELFESPYPSLEIKQGWLPIECACPNDVYLGGDHPRIMILTGPNGTGKSTILKMIAFNTVLACSWGYCLAQQCKINKIAGVISHKYPAENLRLGYSTFMSQEKRARTLLNQLQKKGIHLALLDEPFIGTTEALAAVKIEETAQKMAEHSNTLACIASHFQKPTTLAAKDPSVFVNYQMELRITSNNFERTFKLLPGCADWWFADTKMQAAFINSLCSECG